jgi:hypothetical protein
MPPRVFFYKTTALRLGLAGFDMTTQLTILYVQTTGLYAMFNAIMALKSWGESPPLYETLHKARI